MQSPTPTSSPRPSREHSTNSKFKENLYIYVPSSELPIESSRFSPESPPANSRTQSLWTNAANTVRSSTPIRKASEMFSTTDTQTQLASPPSYTSRLMKLWFNLRTLVSHRKPQAAPVQQPQFAPWPPLHIEKRSCCHDCPCHSASKTKAKKQKRQKIMLYVLIIVILYLLGNTVALNVRVYGSSSPAPIQLGTSNATGSTGQVLSADAQQCLTQFTVNAPSNPTQYPCSTCLSVLRAVPATFNDKNSSDTPQIANAVQFCALRAVFDSASSDAQSALKDNFWVQDVNVCGWNGIQCDTSGKISSLSLTFPAVPSAMPDELGALVALQSLTVIGNSAIPAGALPSNLSSWSTLTTLHLESTSMSSLPDDLFGPLANLTTVTLVKNGNMGQSLPTSITSSSLQNLIVNGQALSNPLSQLSSSQSLQASMHLIDLSDTSISGVIPSTIANFKSLTELHLDSNSLATPLPSTFPSSLQTLSLSNNTGLTGSVQGSFCTLGNLQSCTVLDTGLSAPGGCGVCKFSSGSNATSTGTA